MAAIFYSSIESPLGIVYLTANHQALTALSFEAPPAFTASPNAILQEAQKQLSAYFLKELKTFTLPLEPAGTAFQQSVWNQLMQIPFGTTWSYMQLALSMNNPLAIRAVASANGKNPIPLIIPCHRIINTGGGLGGYSGGLWRKQWLLEWESPTLFS